MKPWLVFTGDTYDHTAWGWDSFRSDFADGEEAKAYAEDIRKKSQWAQIVDTRGTNAVVWVSSRVARDPTRWSDWEEYVS